MTQYTSRGMLFICIHLTGTNSVNLFLLIALMYYDFLLIYVFLILKFII